MVEKTRLTIEQLKAGGSAVVKKFEAAINPATYSLATEACFTDENKLLKEQAEKLELPALVLDGTGVVPMGDGDPLTVPQQLNKLRDVITTPDGDTYRSRPVVRVSWGPLQFEGRVKKVSVTYTLFAPTGVPLRATVKLEFIGPDTPPVGEGRATVAVEHAQLRKQLQVSADTLPQICFNAYADPARNQSVARDNALTSIRNLPPNQTLVMA
ncbi:CIS tube protein [Pseudoduganella armeniaca]|uniref:Peptidoglycan-binding protein n=1 Tax=Pseudoduganella armeniaca TaxID=2072590 RepID=A0A2R4CC34_9BURK|nr:peptidoglycan-binding protein [Pseudoduganella armeniaca]AVR97122.1 peptidoglycan-binding protein [Pseudoduganella armeniaca]